MAKRKTSTPEAENKKLEKAWTGAQRKQKRLFKKRRGGVVLSENEVREIKAGRKSLRKEMKKRKIYTRKEFELTASSMGLYFDKSRFLLLFWWLWGRGLWALLGAGLALALMTYLFSWVTELRGHFTISMSDDLFREGFVLSDTVGFERPTTQLFCEPAVDVPCISISHIPADVDSIDGQHNGSYFAYTFYCRNEGESTVDYQWYIQINSESKNLSKATWVMVFEDGQMAFYAEPGQDGKVDTLPARDDNTRGYPVAPLAQLAKEQDQYELITQKGNTGYYRVIPKPFESETRIISGTMLQVKPQDVHKYTVVMWLEGDDLDCTDELIGGHMGMDFCFELIEPETTEK